MYKVAIINSVFCVSYSALIGFMDEGGVGIKTNNGPRASLSKKSQRFSRKTNVDVKQSATVTNKNSICVRSNRIPLCSSQLQQQQSEEELDESEIPTNRPPSTLTGMNVTLNEDSAENWYSSSPSPLKELFTLQKWRSLLQNVKCRWQKM